MNDNCKSSGQIVEPYMTRYLQEMEGVIEKLMLANYKYRDKNNSVLGVKPESVGTETKNEGSLKPAASLKELLDAMIYRLDIQVKALEENNDRMSIFV